MRTKTKEILWRTRISVPGLGHWLPATMEVMFTTAGPYFGDDSIEPVILGDKDRRETDVQIGESTVAEELP